MYIEPFSKIRVVSSTTSKCKEDSVGYMVSCDMVSDRYNIWDVYLILTKTGKRGKAVLKAVRAYMPIVDVDKVYSAAEVAIIDKIKEMEGLESWGYPKFPRNRIIKPEIKLEVMEYDFKNLISGPIYDYFAFVCALSFMVSRFENKRGMYYTPIRGTSLDPVILLKAIENLVQDKPTGIALERIMLISMHIGGEVVNKLIESFTDDLKAKTLESVWKQVASMADWLRLYKETKLVQTAHILHHLNALVAAWTSRPDLLDSITQNPDTTASVGLLTGRVPMNEWIFQQEKQIKNSGEIEVRIGRNPQVFVHTAQLRFSRPKRPTAAMRIDALSAAADFESHDGEIVLERIEVPDNEYHIHTICSDDPDAPDEENDPF